jgi:hypothetical protein
VARVDTGGCPITGRLTLFKHSHLTAAVIDEQRWKGVRLVMNDKKGEVKLSIGVEPNNPKENNSLTGPTKITVFNHRHARYTLHRNMYGEGGYGDKDGSFSEGLWLSFIYYTVIMWHIHCTLPDLCLT